MLQQETEHLAHAKYRAVSEVGLDGRRAAVPDLDTSRAGKAFGPLSAGRSGF